MASARTNPLKPGVYWIDVFSPSLTKPKWPDGQKVMKEWEAANAFTVIASSEEFNTGTGSTPAPRRNFWKFQVLKSPTAFPFKALGFPTIRKLAPPEQITAADTSFGSNDTVTKPPPEPMFDFGAVFEGVSGPLLLLGLVFLLSQSKGSK